MTVLALILAAAAMAVCIVLGVVVDHQRHTIDRIHPEVLRPDTCCGACPPIALSSLAHGWDGPLWDCTCADNPNCPNYQGETND